METHSSSSSPASHPADQLLDLATRTLWVIYAAFWLALLVYLVVLGVFALSNPGSSSSGSLEAIWLQQPWGLMQIAFAALGIAALMAIPMLSVRLLRAERIWEGTPNLDALATKRGPAQEAADGDPQAQRQAALTGAVQHLLGKVVSGYLVVWALAEVPAILGLVDRVVSGGNTLCLILLFISGTTLIRQRPSRDAMRRLLEPLYQSTARSIDQP